MAKFNFNLRNPGKLTVSPIYLIVRYNNLKLVYPTEDRIPSKFWDFVKKRAINTRRYPECTYLNERLDGIDLTAKEVFRRFLLDNENRPPTIIELRKELNIELLKSPNPRGLSFFNFIEQFIQEAKTRTNNTTGKPLSPATISGYGNTYQLLKDYAKSKRINLDFDAVDLDFYFDFIRYLTEEQRFSINTIGKHIKTLKVFLNSATERGFNTNLAYKSKRFKVTGEDVEKVYLDEKELNEVYKLDLSEKTRLERIRDMFIVGCWTGLRFSDLASLSNENFKEDFIEIEQQKTREKVVIPIHPMVKEIMAKYQDLHNSLPPIISNAKMNSYLKEVMEMVPALHQKVIVKRTKAGVEITKKFKKYELVTVHTARRSFATNLYLSDFPSISIMKITGHLTEQAFLGYIKVTPKENAKLLQMHWEKRFNSA